MQKQTRASFYNHKEQNLSFSLMYGILLSLLFLLVGCGGTTTSVPDAQQLLNQARDAMKQVNSYHFNLTTDHPGTGSSGVSIQTADGDVVAPDKIKAQGNIDLQGIVAQVNIIAIGQNQYYTNPLTGTWTPITGVIDPRALADPQAGIGTLLSQIQHPGTATDSSVDGNSCWSITGQLGSKYIAGIVGDTQATNTNVTTTVCIGKSDHRPYQIQVSGEALQGDSAQTVRTITFSKFNESVSIQAPQA